MTEQEKTLFERNMEMWEKFVNQNMDLMFKSMEKAMEGSQAAQEQVGKVIDRSMEGSQDAQERAAQAINKAIEGSQTFQEQVATAVSGVISAQAEATLVALRALERQVETVSEKMDEPLKSQDPE
jgi:polyhydroxyalkanoate synthesis regulator protein